MLLGIWQSAEAIGDGSPAREKQTLGALQSIRGMHRLPTIFKTNLLRIATQNILKTDEA